MVAIGKCAVSQAGYRIAPPAKTAGIDRTALVAVAAILVIGDVRWSIRRMRKRLGRAGEWAGHSLTGPADALG